MSTTFLAGAGSTLAGVGVAGALAGVVSLEGVVVVVVVDAAGVLLG